MFKFGFAIWLIVNVLATSFVAPKIKDAVHQMAYFALIWCIPVFGAIAATIVAAHRTLRKDEDSYGKTHGVIAEAQKRPPD